MTMVVSDAAMSARQHLAQLAQGMQQDAAGYEALQTLLEAQFHAALRHDAGAMEAVALRIAEQAEQLARQSDARIEHARALLPGGQKLSMTAVFAPLPQALRHQLLGMWNALQAQVTACQALNVRNCQLIMQQAETMRAVLAGGVVTEDIYAPR